MPDLAKIYSQTQAPSGKPGTPSGNVTPPKRSAPDVSSGTRAVAKGLANIGEAAAKVWDMGERSKLARLKTEALEAFTGYESDLQGRSDYQLWGEEFKGLAKDTLDRGRQQLGSRVYADEYELSVRTMAARSDAAIQGQVMLRQADEIRANTSSSFGKLMTSMGNTKGGRRRTEILQHWVRDVGGPARESGAISAQEYQERYDELKYEATRRTAWDVAVALYGRGGQEALDGAIKSLSGAVDVAGSAGHEGYAGELEEDDRASLASALTTMEANRLKAEKAEKEAGWEGLRQGFFDALVRDPGKLPEMWVSILNSDMPVTGDGGKKSLQKMMEDRNKALLGGEDDPTELHDPATSAEISRLLNTGPAGFDEVKKRGGLDYIYSLVGKGKEGGISVALAEKYAKTYKDLDEGKPSKNPRVDAMKSRYHSTLGSLKTKKLFDDDELENAKIYGTKANLLDKFFEDNPEATDAQAEEYFNGLVTEEKEGWFGKVWNEFWDANRLKGAGLDSVNQEVEEVGKERKAREAEQGLRDEAIKLLKDNNRAVTEETVKIAIDRIKAARGEK